MDKIHLKKKSCSKKKSTKVLFNLLLVINKKYRNKKHRNKKHRDQKHRNKKHRDNKHRDKKYRNQKHRYKKCKDAFNQANIPNKYFPEFRLEIMNVAFCIG